MSFRHYIPVPYERSRMSLPRGHRQSSRHALGRLFEWCSLTPFQVVVAYRQIAFLTRKAFPLNYFFFVLFIFRPSLQGRSNKSETQCSEKIGFCSCNPKTYMKRDILKRWTSIVQFAKWKKKYSFKYSNYYWWNYNYKSTTVRNVFTFTGYDFKIWY